MRRTALAMVIAASMFAGCAAHHTQAPGPVTAASLREHCVVLCTRGNTVCGREADCEAGCPAAGMARAAERCGAETEALLACSAGLPDAAMCSSATPVTCAAEMTALQRCHTAHPVPSAHAP